MEKLVSKEEYDGIKDMKSLIIVSAEWCNPCKKVKEYLREYLRNNEIMDGKIYIMDYDNLQEDGNEELLGIFEPKKLPTFFKNEGGEIRERRVMTDEKEINEYIMGNFEIKNKCLENISDDF